MFSDYSYDAHRNLITAYCDERRRRVDLNDASGDLAPHELWAEEEQRLLEEKAKRERILKALTARRTTVSNMLDQMLHEWDNRSNWQGSFVWSGHLIAALFKAGYLKELT